MTICKKGRAVAVMMSMQDFEAYEAKNLKLLQQVIDERRVSGLSDRSMVEFIADAEEEATADDYVRHA